MDRLTTDAPKTNLESALNLFYVKNGEAWVLGGGPGPEHQDVSLFDFVRRIIKIHVPYMDVALDNDELSEMMAEWLFDGPNSIEGLIATLYTAAWAFAELRHKLAAYEDTGLEPEAVENIKLYAMGKAIAEIKEFEGIPINHLKELVRAEQDERLVVLPCKVGDTVYQVFSPKSGIPVIVPRQIKTVGQAADLAGRMGKKCKLVSVYTTRAEAEAALKGGDEG